ncbi:Leucine-rich repeat serine/threonine-protein kinase 1 [Trichinella pseudospiralis]|uniref:non-specific serine/threonine protein kinase n=1 Tax=Trichinella pseudospiralis TaxID=6337 RepID=A0A0V1ISW7_TRIPS|nr:Leucine-rich repeat serine/threonine-protein kinase 1 [Trichinella pseudospiralis]
MIDAKVEDDISVILQTLSYGNGDLLRELLRSDFQHYVHWQNEFGQTFLHIASSVPGNSCVKVLLEEGSEVNATTHVTCGSKTPLHLSAAGNDVNTCILLVQYGADLFARDSEGNTPLQCAQMQNFKEVSNYLLDEIEKRRIKITELQDKLHVACMKADLNETEFLLKEAESNFIYGIVNEPLLDGSNLLFKVCEAGLTKVAELLIKFGSVGIVNAASFNSPLHIAITANHVDIVKLLLKHFPELVQMSTSGKCLPIHTAARVGNLEMVKLLLENPYPKYVLNSYLVENSEWQYRMPFDVNAVDDGHRSALLIAVEAGYSGLVEYLLQFHVVARPLSGQQLLLQNSTATTLAAGGGGGGSDALPVVQFKKFRPVQANLRCASGYTALHLAVLRGSAELVKLLAKNGADLQAPISGTALQTLDNSGEELNGAAGALLLACFKENMAMVDLLLKVGATDMDNKVLAYCLSSNRDTLVTKLLSRLVFPDPEFRVNKKAVNVDWMFQVGRGKPVAPSALYPSTAVMLNWHGSHLSLLEEHWLASAALQLNPRCRPSPTDVVLSACLSAAITRIDVSKNSLSTLPRCLFQLPSLRILNASNNNITSLGLENERSNQGLAVSLEDVYLERNLLDSVPSILFTFPKLVTLNLADNKLKQLPSNMWQCVALKELNLAGNQLRTLPAKSANSVNSSSSLLSTTPSSLACCCCCCSVNNNSSGDYCCLSDAEMSLGGEQKHSDLTTVSPSSVSVSVDTTVSMEFADESVSIRQFSRHSLWPKQAELLKLTDDSSTKGDRFSLSTLNLARNLFEQVPQALSCLAPALTRLNLSHNCLQQLGPIHCYPSTLKHLDVSHNRIRRWFTVKRKGCVDTSHESRSPSRGPPLHSSPIINSRRSHSVSRMHHRYERSNDRSPLASAGCCAHRQHCRLINLRTLLLADNCLRSVTFFPENDNEKQAENFEANLSGLNTQEKRLALMFPNVSTLDLARNMIVNVPVSIALLQSLAVLNLSENRQIACLPPEMGLLGKLWNLNLTGCGLDEPFSSMIESNKCKTIDIISYLKSVLEDSKTYSRLKLMVVGVQGIGKTSLLEQLRAEGIGPRRPAQEGWARRMGNKTVGSKTASGINISTVGVDVNEWTYQPKRQKGRQRPPITFRTWDFGGQREYYATHQYFLSKRSIYLVVWKVSDGEAGIAEFTQWLINIQARAPNSPVIIVGTHVDAIRSNHKRFPAEYLDKLQTTIRERFISINDPDKRGLPRVVDSLAVSCVTREQIRTLCELIYNTAYELRTPGSKERLIEQRIPSSYVALEEIVIKLAAERKQAGREPVISAQTFRNSVQELMLKQTGRTFRDTHELNLAVVFLHENGVLLHYDDSTLKDLYFLDPQWLCDVLAHVITVREINPFAKGGLMKVDDLKILHKATRLSVANIRSYALNLLQKFEVALTWDNKTLLIPSLLPDEYQLRAGYPGCNVKVPVNARIENKKDDQWSILPTQATVESCSTSMQANLSIADNVEGDSSGYKVVAFHENVQQGIRRLYVMLYFPCGFWSRLITRIIGDDKIAAILNDHYLHVSHAEDPALVDQMSRTVLADNKLEWRLWQTGLEVNVFGVTLISVKEFLPLAQVRDVDYRDVSMRYKQDTFWSIVNADQSSVLELYFPHVSFEILTTANGQEPNSNARFTLTTNRKAAIRLLALTVEILDTLLEDWYPSLGTRFIHTSEGRYLVTRLVPCPCCLSSCLNSSGQSVEDEDWTVLPNKRSSGDAADAADICTNFSEPTAVAAALKEFEQMIEKNKPQQHPDDDDKFSTNQQQQQQQPLLECVCCFTVEECIHAASEASSTVRCFKHGTLSLSTVAPDTVFLDLSDGQLIVPSTVKRGKMLGRGAFGFVFKATANLRNNDDCRDVALKILHPVDPGFGAKASALAAFKAASSKWKRDPIQHACRSYCTARQELNILLKLKHSCIVPLVGVCPRPLSLAFVLAPLGSLGALLMNYRRSGARINWTSLQETAFQIAKALEYLHRSHVIYRDLKSENVLVWHFPPPFSSLTTVEVKLGDYGISRNALPAGHMKGFGGTEGFMAPEIMRYNGEEEYTDKVDCFSFGMFLYELYTLRLPFEGQEQVKEYILDGGRPNMSVKDIAYPCNFLDLMIKCWSQQPSERPSSSQLVSLTAAPEFSHLLDVVSLNEPEVYFTVGEAFINDSFPVDENMALEGEIWICRTDGQVSILSSDGGSWFEYKNIIIDKGTFVTALCLVNDFVWVADLTGMIRIYCTKMYNEVMKFSIANCVLRPSEWNGIVSQVQVERVHYVEKLDLVVLSVCTPPTLILCSSDPHSSEALVIKSVHDCCTEGSSIICSTFFPSATADGVYYFWAGRSGGNISVYKLQNRNLFHVESFSHRTTSDDYDSETSQLVSSCHSSVIYQWETETKKTVAKLDCSKLVPCSESLYTMNVEERLTPSFCQVSALYLLEKEDCSQLYVGTTWGVIIVAEADQLKPITAFRPYVEDVRLIAAFTTEKRTAVGSATHQAASSTGSDRSARHQSTSSEYAQRTKCSAGSLPAYQERKSSLETAGSFSTYSGRGPLLVTVGRGYRSLISRFVDSSSKPDPKSNSLLERDHFAILWRTDDWTNF